MRPGYVRPGLSVDEAYRRWNMRLIRKRKEMTQRAGSKHKRLIKKNRTFTDEEIVRMKAMYAKGMTKAKIAEELGVKHSSLAYHLNEGEKERIAASKNARRAAPGGTFSRKLEDFNKSFSQEDKKTPNSHTNIFHEKIRNFIGIKGGPELMVKKKEILEKLWPGENNEKRTDYKTKCALTGEPIDLDARKGEPGYSNLDHELARARGGSNDADNCQPLSSVVNTMKGDMTNEELFEKCKQILNYQGYTVKKL